MWPADILHQSQYGVAVAPVGNHPGLYWRYGGQCITAENRDTYRDAHVTETCTVAAAARGNASEHGKQYRIAFSRRTAWLKSQGCELESVRLLDRLKTGVGEPGVFECQVELHPATGMPRLAGSGLHGLLAAWCFERLDRIEMAANCKVGADPGADEPAISRDDLLALFGSRWGDTAARAGLLSIADAWWDPYASIVDPLVAERDTPHHPDYYTGRSSKMPSDMDSPNPVPQIAVQGHLQLAILHRNVGAEWAAVCMAWLLAALQESGAGASRRVGYGRIAAPPP